jgi:elongation factor P hydroxylase
MNNDLKNAIGYFEASVVEKFNIDLLAKKISLKVVINNNEKVENHEIIFQGVSAFYFSNGQGDARFNLYNWDSIEISDIGYYEQPKDHITCMHGELGTHLNNSDPNFNLDIWGTLFLIEAQEVIIDNVIYQAR